VARQQSQPAPVRLRFAEFELDEENASLWRDGEAVSLAPTPFSLLCELARRPGSLVTKNALLDAVWGHRFVSESVLKTAVSDVRKVLADDPRRPRFIETVSRRGYRFLAAPPSASALPAASNLTVRNSLDAATSFIGRTAEIASLEQAWRRANAGERAVVWLAGEPGIGKTTLIEHFLASLGEVACARGQCVEHYGTGEPYLPVLEALAELCRGDTALPALLRDVAPTWLLQLPWLSSAEQREALRHEVAGNGPERMLREMGELLDRYTEQRPLLLVTEDLHWADRSTVQLINYIARRRGRTRLMWLSSFRLAEVVALDHPVNSIRHELRLQRLCEEVVLDPFSETEVAAFVERRSASLARDETFVRALHARTDGVPLFVSSIFTELMVPAENAAHTEAKLAKMAVPESLAAIIHHYIAKLEPDQRALLSVAAVYGTSFRVETVSLALDLDLTLVSRQCEALMREHLWLTQSPLREEHEASEPLYTFRHALFRQVLYECTPRSVRATLHRQVGVALERERSAGIAVAPSELAMHFDRAHLPMTAVHYYAEAAQAALLHFSPELCLSLAEQAWALLARSREVPESDALGFTLATLQGVASFHSSGVGDDAKAAFEHAYRLLDKVPMHPMRARLLHGFGYLLSLRGDYPLALAVAERAEALSRASGDSMLMLAACIVHGEIHHLQGRTQSARAWLERALAIAQTLKTDANEVFAADPQVMLHGMLAIELLRSGLCKQAQAHMELARARAQASSHPMTRLVCTWHQVLMAVRMGNHLQVATLASDMQALVDEFSLALGRSACRWWRGWAQARNGAAIDGYRHIREAFDHHIALGMRSGASEVLGYAAEALLLAGDCEAAQTQLQEALRMGEALGERVYLPQLLLLEGAIARKLGRFDRGAAAVRRAIAEARAQQAAWLELQGMVELCQYHDATPADHEALLMLLMALPEADGTALITHARHIAGAKARLLK